MPFEIRFTKEAFKDVQKLTPKLKTKLQHIVASRISSNPYSGKKLVGDLEGFYSVRLTFQDRIIYTVDNSSHTVIIHKARTHYGE